MSKQVLIISPYFVPTNAADMHRVRTSMPFYAEHGWNAEVVAVDPHYSDFVKDELLKQSLPAGIKIHYVKAWTKRWTSKLGLGSIALRSLWYYLFAVNKLLTRKHYDVIFFSTTQFPVLVLARFWKARFKVKIVFDMQDPWHTNFYKNRPKEERPKKFWFSYHLNRLLEPIAMRAADGLISVSSGYINVLQERYPWLEQVPVAVIPFGLHVDDLKIAKEIAQQQNCAVKDHESFNLIYVGRGGYDLLPALKHLLKAIKLGLQTDAEIFQHLRVKLYGTSYAAAGKGKSTFNSEIDVQGLSHMIEEYTDRLPYYQTLNTLRHADLLLIPGSLQGEYTASKLFPYLLAQRPILAIVHQESSATSILCKLPYAGVFSVSQENLNLHAGIKAFLKNTIKTKGHTPEIPLPDFQKFTSAHLTKVQTRLFDQVCRQRN